MRVCVMCVVCLWLQVQGTNGLVARWNHLGFAATAESRQLRDVAGQLLQVCDRVSGCRTQC